MIFPRTNDVAIKIVGTKIYEVNVFCDYVHLLLQALEPRFRSALSQSRGFRKVPKLRFYMYPGPGKSREKGRTVQGLEDAGNVSMQPNSSESIRALSGVGDVLSMGEEDDDDAVAMPERMREFLVDSPAPIPFMHEIIVESSAPTQEDLPISR